MVVHTTAKILKKTMAATMIMPGVRRKNARSGRKKRRNAVRRNKNTVPADMGTAVVKTQTKRRSTRRNTLANTVDIVKIRTRRRNTRKSTLENTSVDLENTKGGTERNGLPATEAVDMASSDLQDTVAVDTAKNGLRMVVLKNMVGIPVAPTNVRNNMAQTLGPMDATNSMAGTLEDRTNVRVDMESLGMRPVADTNRNRRVMKEVIQGTGGERMRMSMGSGGSKGMGQAATEVIIERPYLLVWGTSGIV
jgi:hypothetical protein